MSAACYLGIDIGTSGVRASVIDDDGAEVASSRVSMPAPVRDGASSLQDSSLWIRALQDCLQRLADAFDASNIAAIAVDATSGSVLLCSEDGRPLTAAMMYNDTSSQRQAQRIAEVAAANSGAHGAGSSLAKLLAMRAAYPQLAADHLCHQADVINGWLCGRYDTSDENNCLKLGYDAAAEAWPEWMQALGVPHELLPRVVRPGIVIGELRPALVRRFGFGSDCKVASGTTDSIAAFIASGACEPGDAVTSLGSSLVIKQLCAQPVYDSEHGVYSHRYPFGDELWLVGGASNTGGKVLSELFSRQQLEQLSQRIDPEQDTGLDYTALPQGTQGERFPVADPELRPRLQPRPADDALYLQGLLESIADVEQRGYELLQQLGCERPRRVLTAGGGSHNQAWNRIRERRLALPVTTAEHSEASIGAALLARYAMQHD